MNTSTMLFEASLVNVADAVAQPLVEELTLDALSLVGGGCDPYNML